MALCAVAGPAGSAARWRNPLVRAITVANRAALRAAGMGTPGEVRALEDITCERILSNLPGAPPSEAPERPALASPITHVAIGCPATLIFHGSHDSLSPVASARALHARLAEAGVPAVYNELPRTEHAYSYILPEWSPAVRATLCDTERFLALLA